MSNIVTFEQAKKLNRLGYNKYTPIAYFKIKQVGMANEIPFGVILKDTYQAPTVSEALDYLREEKEIYCGVYPFMWGYKGMAIIQDKFNPCTIEIEPLDAYYISESALLTAVLDYLDKKGGEE
ncbi:MAG: hypothetical protein QM660_10680 [Dysgonomonas sp.]